MATKIRVDNSVADDETTDSSVITPSTRVADRPGAGTLRTISSQVKAKKEAQTAIDEAVLQARQDGCSWVQIATALGVSPQGARQKYLARIPA